jgi:hypothetical protein
VALAGAGAGLVVVMPVLAGAEAVFSRARVWDADFSGAADVACPRAVGAGSVRISGTCCLRQHSQQFRRRWHWRRYQEHPVEPPVSIWTSGAEVSCSGGRLSFTGEEVFSGAAEDARAGEETGLIAGMSGRMGDAGLAV